MTSQATDVYTKIDSNLGALLVLHPSSDASSVTPGRPQGEYRPLLQAGVVLLATAWENYVEQAVLEAFEAVIASPSLQYSDLSHHLQGQVKGAGKKDVQSVIGDGWRTVAQAEVVDEVDRLNNAGPGQVTGLVFKTLGIPDVLDLCTWRGMSKQRLRSKLEHLIDEVRGDIVHKGATQHTVDYILLSGWRDFVRTLTARADKVIAEEVWQRYGVSIW